MWWNLVQLVVLVYVAMFVPVRVAWGNEPETYSAVWFVELCIDCYFLVDIFLNFRVRLTVHTVRHRYLTLCAPYIYAYGPGRHTDSILRSYYWSTRGRSLRHCTELFEGLVLRRRDRYPTNNLH